MNWRDPKLWLAGLSAMGVGILAARDLSATSPGELTAVHGREPDLAGRGGCASCHGSKGVTLADACLECHQDVALDLSRGTGMHGTFEAVVRTQCALCHGEHHGVDFPMVNGRTFAIAGVPDVSAFEHDSIGFAMEGKHTELECTECHEHAQTPVLPEGARRWLGLAQDCSTCHEDPHQGRMARGCADCHGQHDFHDLATFAHDGRFPLTGAHATPACADCHEPGGPQSVEADAALGGPARWRDCATCHDSPHADALLSGVAAFQGVAPGESCAACHDAEHASFRGDVAEMTAELHAASGFSLEAPHDRAECADCHSPYAPLFELRYPGRSADACDVCHQDPHGGQFDGGPFAAGCLVCHDRHAFEPHAFAVPQHALTAMPLTGRHVDAECHACHRPPLGAEAIVFAEAADRCEACHADSHEGLFGGASSTLADVAGGTCAACHDTDGFGLDEPRREGFDHGLWTGFVVDGAHAQATCEACHPRREDADEQGRTFGRASDPFGPVEGCATCHADPHGGTFDDPGLPADVEGRSDCARCHTTTSFRDFPDGFDHGRWTGYPLLGAHRPLSCSACHRPVPGGDRQGRSFAAASGTRCQDCHGDPHAGQFRRDGDLDCTRCHSTTQSFHDLSFDHERDARFPLGEAHRALECSKCHEPWAATGGAEIVRYRPIAHECSDCHGADAEQLKRKVKRGGR